MIIHKLYAPYLHPITAPNFTAGTGEIYSLSRKPEWDAPLRNQVIIIDTDSRPFNGTNELLNETRLDWDKADGLSNGVYGHYLYATIHGYDYKFVRTPEFDDRGPCWAKPMAVADLLKSYRFVIFMDSDTVWRFPEIPLEWLLNYWNFTKETSVAMALDPAGIGVNYDSFGKLVHNSGFVIAQSNERTKEIFKAWVECPDGIRYPECKQWANNWSFDQRAFADHVRYDFNKETDVLDLPCNEANGYPESHPGLAGECHGVFVRHHWIQKQRIKPAVMNSIMHVFMERMHDEFLEGFDKNVLTRQTNDVVW
ncbi:hypothetical protein H2201_000278 [Coniosporium apollinis]|uniref:Nucleotide-diphospho-sugar transferase domain-containing protein n=1 Tax=Coniosporium apollinis TaxID=61459 RepID=A0ABQ9P7X9_9PEZI|nr:hypothetical protein H2201_000278 [Coniosporium apollinis]